MKSPAPVIFRIQFTGERHNRHFLVKIDDRDVWLPIAQFTLLLRLVAARATRPPGFLKAHRRQICRLRKNIDQAVGRKAGHRLIAAGGGDDYHVPIDPTRFTPGQCTVASFFDLLDKGIIHPDSIIAAWLGPLEKSASAAKQTRKS
jgi:hypothetical protein